VVVVTAEDLQRVEQLELELAAAGREPERTAVRKALTLLRRAAIERLERAAGADDLPSGSLPDEGQPPLRTLDEAREERLAALLAAGGRGELTAADGRELRTLLDTAEVGAMRNVLALVRDHAPNSDVYVRALQAYRRSFSRIRTDASRPSPRRRRRAAARAPTSGG
jgi:hypothetical protein